MMDVVESQNMTIATIRRVPVDLIIHTLAERFKDSTEEGHDRLAMGLYACIDSNGLAEEWAVSGGVAQTAEWMATVITGHDSWREPTAAETRVAEVAVSKRLLTVACNLCVTQDAEDHAAATALLRAASRILSVDSYAWRASGFERIYNNRLQANGYEVLISECAEVRAIIDAALGTTKDAPTFTLKQVAEELAAQHKAHKLHVEAFERSRERVRMALGGRDNEGLADVADRVVKERDAAERKARDAIIDRDSANLGRAIAAKENDKQIANLIAERDAANEAHRIDAANLTAERDSALQQRDAHSATIERLLAAVNDALATEPAVDVPAIKTRPQPGDVVPWADVEDGALYYRPGLPFAFRAVTSEAQNLLDGPNDGDLLRLLEDGRGNHLSELHDGPALASPTGILVARYLGADPEAWRKAMREWTANGNKPTQPARA